MHTIVFAVIVMVSAYSLSLRLSGLMEVDTSVGRRYSTIVREDLSVALCVWGLSIGNKHTQDCGFFLFSTGESQTSYCCCSCVVGAGWSRRS